MADEMVLDAPVLDAVDDVQDEVIDDAPVEDLPEDGEVAAVESEVKEDWRKVPANLKEFFKTPEGKAAKDAWYERGAFKEKFPEGIKQVDAVMSFLDEHGGKESLLTSLGELKGQAEELSGIQQAFAAGDPKILDRFIQDAPEGFAKMAPIMAQKWAEVDPEGWQASMSGVMAATMQQHGIGPFIERMALQLEFGKTAEVSQALQQLKEWAGGFQQRASAPVAAKSQPDARMNEREQQLNQRDEQMFNSDMNRDIDSFRNTTISKQLETFFSRRPKDEDAKGLAIDNVTSQVIKRMSADKDFQKSLNSLTAKRDKDGAMRLIKSRETAAILEIAPKVGRTIFGQPAVAKPTTTPTRTPPVARPVVQTDPKKALLNEMFSRS
jgi:hypothetical protein